MSEVGRGPNMSRVFQLLERVEKDIPLSNQEQLEAHAETVRQLVSATGEEVVAADLLGCPRQVLRRWLEHRATVAS